MIDSILSSLSKLLEESVFLSPFIAFLAGVITSFLPCSLSTLPLIIGYVGSGSEDTMKNFRLSLVFALGSAIVFTILGVVAALAGSLFGGTSRIWYLFLGTLMILMALQVWHIFDFIPSTYLQNKNHKRGYIGALSAGVLAGLFSSPCSTPVLIALLAFVSSSGNTAKGALLLFCYSIGYSILAVIAGTGTGFVKRIKRSGGYSRLSTVLEIVLGLLILILGLYMLYLGF